MERPLCFPRLAKIPGLKMIALSSLGSVGLRMPYLPCPFPRHHCGDPAVILLTLVTEVSRTYPLQLLVQIRGTLMAPGARAVGGSMASTLKLGQTPEEGVPLPNELPLSSGRWAGPLPSCTMSSISEECGCTTCCAHEAGLTVPRDALSHTHDGRLWLSTAGWSFFIWALMASSLGLGR